MDYKALYEQQLAATKAKVQDSSLNTTLALKKMSGTRLKDLTDQMSKCTNKPVWKDFHFRCGDILGLLRFITQNSKQRQELLDIVGLTSSHIDVYYDMCGNLPYVNTDNTVNVGRPMNIEGTKELVLLVASELGLLLTDSDVTDITEERWTRLYSDAMERAVETAAFNLQNSTAGELHQYDE